ncbi:MAG: hypothetical protein WAV20_17770 [Blastocatellia bacterium]
MKHNMRLLSWLLIVAFMLTGGGCKQKPAYSEIETNKAAGNQNSNNEAKSPAIAADAQASPEPAPAPPQTPKLNNPSFMNPSTGDIADLPNYPRAQRVNVRIGPVEGVNLASIALITGDPMDKIAAFYEQTIKKNNWTVSDKIRDSELSEWTLSKGASHSAKVQIKRDPQTARMNIILVRAEKLEASTN